MTTTHELIKKVIGPTLRELIEKGDYETARQIIWYHWVGMICVGFVLGVSLARLGLI
jgi:hypothetical protein